jgi:hypothetical protein
MKKSEMYKKAQIAILQMDGLTFNDTLEILRVLMDDEEMAKWSEDKAEKEKQEEMENAET